LSDVGQESSGTGRESRGAGPGSSGFGRGPDQASTGRNRTRRLLVLGLALIVVAGLVVADIVTLSKAKPSFENETRAFQHLLAPPSASSTTSSTSSTSTTPTTPAPSTTSGVSPSP